MRLQAFIGSIALSGAAAAFSDATPWVFYSTASFPLTNHQQLQSSFDILRITEDILSRCPTDHYVLATQPGMNAADLHDQGSNMPSLHQSVTRDDRIQGKYIVSEVVGDINGGNLANFIRKACSQHGKQATVEQVPLGQLPQEDRVQALLLNGPNREKDNAIQTNETLDRVLGERIDKDNGHDSFTVLFYATRPEPAYEAQFDEAVHQDLRRATRDSDTVLEKDNRPLFEKYQFFTPGIFMGLITTVALFSILGVGIKGLSSLKVSYGAFEKEMGPSAQKKQQ